MRNTLIAWDQGIEFVALLLPLPWFGYATGFKAYTFTWWRGKQQEAFATLMDASIDESSCLGTYAKAINTLGLSPIIEESDRLTHSPFYAMFLDFFLLLKRNGLPVSIREYLTLLEALHQDVPSYEVEEFYYLSRTILVKHEQFLDRFDELFGQYFQGIEAIGAETFARIPEEWLTQHLERELTDEEKALIEALGGLDKLMERLKALLDEQKERHEGGNKWIGTAGTSPFGNSGYHPEGIRFGQPAGKQGRAVKVWDQRDYRNLDDTVELNTRHMKMALRRLRILTREGVADELDLEDTIQETSKNAGLLDIRMVPSRQNRVKVLLLLDVGGSMDEHVELCAQLFSAARYQFKHLETYYFHNCLYETLWKDNRRRGERIATYEVLHKYNSDYKVIIVSDASMAQDEITSANGSVEHANQELGIVWLNRLKARFPYLVWLNPTVAGYWQYTHSIQLLREWTDNRMFPLTLSGLGLAMRALRDKKVRYDA